MADWTVRVTPRPAPSLKLNLTFSDVKLMRSIGRAMVGRIRARTAKGVDVNGSPFQALSAGYRRAKKKALGHGQADLTVSGQMLQGMVAKPTKENVTISFAGGGRGGGKGGTFIQRSRSVGAADKAFFHNETGAGRARVIREFFGLSDEDEAFILDRVSAFIAKEIKLGI